MPNKPLAGHVAVVAGATRGTGRGIALALGEAGATVYCTGRSVRGRTLVPPVIPPDASERQSRRAKAHALAARPETIDETAEMVTGLGGRGIALRVDHTQEAEVRALFERVAQEQDGRLDILVNDIWGGGELTEHNTPFWEMDLDKGFLMMDRAVRAHIITSRYGVPLMIGRRRGLIIEVTDGTGYNYHGPGQFYSLCKVSAIHLAEAMAADLDRRLGEDHAIAAVALTPAFLRSEAMLDALGVTEAGWRDAIAEIPSWALSETPLFAGRAVAALAADPRIKERTGRVFSTWDLSDEYHFLDADGTRPHWGRGRRYLVADARRRGARSAPLEDWFDNAGTGDDAAPGTADLDGNGWSLSARALETAGVRPGGMLTVDGLAFRWPQPGPGAPNNVMADGQVLELPPRPGATRIGILGLSTRGPSGGEGHIGYADGSTQPFTLRLPDWVSGERDGLPPGTRVAVRLPGWNTRGQGATDVTTMVFAAICPLRADTRAATLTLPARVAGPGEQHIFAVALGGAEP